MSREILEAVRAIESEKGIEAETLIEALEDALLAAYKKTPGAARHAQVVARPRERRLPCLRDRAACRPRGAAPRRGARARDPGARGRRGRDRREVAHAVSDVDLDIDWSDVPGEQIARRDVTPENFGRIAAQTAKQVILQRIREAERAMMYEEYVDRVGEVVTGIVQQAGDRNNVLVDLGKVEALLPRSEQVDGERYEQGSRIKAVITEVRSGTKGPQVILSRRDPGADPDAVRARGSRGRGRARRDPRRRPRARLPLEDRRRSPTPRASTRSAPAWARGARACAWSCPSCAARRSTSFRGTPSPHGSSPRRCRPRGCARCSSTTRASEATVARARRPAVARDRQGGHERAARGPADRLACRHPVRDASTPRPRPRPRSRAAARTRSTRGAARAVLSTGKRCPNASLPGSRYCGIPAHRELAARRARPPLPERMPPFRTCVGCGRQAPKTELARFVASGASLARDPAGRLPGRGAYSARARSASSAPSARRAFTRTLRCR